MNENTPQFSIIVPVYCASRYLRDCLEAIKRQSFQDWECICIDDGSSDTSSEILYEYAVTDSRFCYFHQQNKGVSVARNIGIENARGDYFTFVDADDVLLQNALNFWHETLHSTRADILVEGNVLRFTDELPKVVEIMADSKHCMTSQEVAESFFQRNILGWACGKVYSRRLQFFFRFPGGIAMLEDAFAIHNVLKYELNWCILKENSHYAYRRSDESACATFSAKHRLDTLVVLHGILEILQNLGYSVEQLKNYWISGNISYYTQGPEDCYNKLSSADKLRFEQEVRAISKMIGMFPYDCFMWLRLNVLHGYLEVIPRFGEYLYYGLRKSLFDSK